MIDRKPPQVFICHASEDKPAARELYYRLIKDGIDAWLDEKKLLPGQDWRLEISRAVKNSGAIIVCLSSKSVKKEGFVQKEIRLALDVAEEKPEGTIYFIPVRLDECIVPDSLHKYHWVDLFKEEGYEKIKQALRMRFNLLENENSPNLDQKDITSSKSAQLTIIIEKDILSFSNKEIDSFVFVISKLTGVSANQIRILRVAEGSVVITLEMPEIGAKRLMELYYKNDTEIEKLGISKITFTFEAEAEESNQPQAHSKNRWDCFISYASEDRESVASLLANELRSRGIRVWYDQFEIRPGMQLLRSINDGLANSSFGIVILSPQFFAKEWTQRELAGLYNLSIREGDNPFIIPIWYKIGVDEIRKYSPLLSDIISIPWELGLEEVTSKILSIINPNRYKDPDEESVKVLAETYKALNKDDFLNAISNSQEIFSLSSIIKALESILLNSERSRELRVRALETILTLKVERPNVINQILTSNDTDFLKGMIDLFTRKEITLTKDQIELLFTNRSLPKSTTGLGNMIRKFIERGAPYTSEVFLPGANYPSWEIKYDCVRTIVQIGDKDSLRVLSKFSTMRYWKARRTIIDYISERMAQKRLDNDDGEIAKDILSQIVSDGKSDSGTPTMRRALEALKSIDSQQ